MSCLDECARLFVLKVVSGVDCGVQFIKTVLQELN